jgi:RNA polymerase sigma factor (sigma-70 family)
MCKQPKPSGVRAIFARPGQSWTAAERAWVKRWLHEEPQLRLLLAIAYSNLPRGATFEDAEDAWGDYCCNDQQGKDQLDRVMDSYVPEKHRSRCFWPYLCFCFRRWCRRRPARQAGSRPLVLVAGTIPAGVGSDPTVQAAHKEMSAILAEAIAELPPPYGEVIRLRYFEGFTLKEVVRRRGSSIATVYRHEQTALLLLRDWLIQHYPGIREV